jgi:radical SAM superfamily enzyme YgiQ (UPF0313 family)
LHNGFDVVVRSEGEETARELMEWVAAGAEPSELERVLGVAYLTESGSVAVNGPRPWIKDLDSLPFPRRDEHIMRPYLDAWKVRHGYVSLPIFGARGCPFDCAFCYRPVFGKYYRMRSPANVVAEIEECVERFGAQHLRFVDDTFVIKRQWVQELSRLVAERDLGGVSFDVLSRADLMNEESAADWKRMGVKRSTSGWSRGLTRSCRG